MTSHVSAQRIYYIFVFLRQCSSAVWWRLELARRGGTRTYCLTTIYRSEESEQSRCPRSRLGASQRETEDDDFG